MNTNGVEARLEALAAQSASPVLPTAILDRMADLEAGGTLALAPVHSGGVHSTRRVHLGRGPRARGVMLLGAAAALALVSGLMYAGGNRPIQSNPAPTHTFQTRPVPVQTLPIGPVQPEPTPPFSLGPWTKAYTFADGWIFGGIWGGGPVPAVQLSWQNGEIVGVAERYKAVEGPAGIFSPEAQQACVLQSKDGTNWTCSELPTPTGEPCGPGPCPAVTGVAVRDGHWVAVGSTNFRSPAAGDVPGGQSAMTLLTWTSSDGLTWKEQTSARSTATFQAQPGFVGLPTPPTLLATSKGFVMSRCGEGQPGLWTSADGTNWQPATFAPGLGTMSCATLGAASTAGYMASGYCPISTMPYHQCVAFSADGTTWTTSDPAAGASSDLASQLRIFPGGANYVGGHWIVVLDDSAVPSQANPVYYEASSTDGIKWSMSRGPWANFLSTDPGLNEGETHVAMFSQLATVGYWGVNNGPIGSASSAAPSPGWTLTPAGSKTYWSPTGIRWQTVSDAPPGWPVAVVETPSGLIVLMDTGPVTSPTTTVWVAPKR
jgi:hypothetical protein